MAVNVFQRLILKLEINAHKFFLNFCSKSLQNIKALNKAILSNVGSTRMIIVMKGFYNTPYKLPI